MSSSNPNEEQILLEAFQSFSQAAEGLQTAYSELKDHALQLNQELDATNKKLSASLEEQQNLNSHFQAILMAMKTGILVLQLDGIVTDMNPSAVMLTGVEHQKVHYTELAFPQEVKDYIQTCLEKTLARIPRLQVQIEKEDGDLAVELSFSPVRDKDRRIMSLLILLQDVTLLNQLQGQSERNARLAAMGEMAAELAHEIRNPLGGIKLLGNLLTEEFAEHPEKSAMVNQLNQSVQTIDSTLSNMLTFSADIHPRLALVDLKQILDEVKDLINLELENKEIEFKRNVPSKNVHVPGDGHLLKQLFMNLCLNAIRAMKRKEGCLRFDLVVHEDYVQVVIRDNGCGIEEKHLKKLFDPFFSLAEGGTGLGLSVAHKIVEKHKGALELKSKLGEGTTVYVSLPLFDGRMT